MTLTPRTIVRLDETTFAANVAGRLATWIASAIQRDDACRIVLAGGRTPAAVYRALARLDGVAWDKVHAYIGDERCVPPDHADSNFRMIHETLLSQVPIPAQQVHRMRGELDAAAAAEEYDRMVASLPEPTFHLVLNGVGADGHTASLFPGDQRIARDRTWAATAHAPPQFAVAARVTLTLRALNATELSVTFCTGDDKRTVRDMILAVEEGTPSLPASLLRGLDQTVWFIDEH